MIFSCFISEKEGVTGFYGVKFLAVSCFISEKEWVTDFYRVKVLLVSCFISGEERTTDFYGTKLLVVSCFISEEEGVTDFYGVKRLKTLFQPFRQFILSNRNNIIILFTSYLEILYYYLLQPNFLKS